jgi:hypothetical protein
MTYEELQNRLNRVETAITALKTGSYHDLDFNVEQTLGQLEQTKTSLQEQLSTLSEDKEPEHLLKPLEKKIDKTVAKQKASPDTAALALLANINKNVALDHNITHKTWTDDLRAHAPQVVNRLKAALEGKFKYYGDLLDVDYAGLERELEKAEYTGTRSLPDNMDALKALMIKKVDEGETTDSHVVTKDQASRREIEKVAREKGVSTPEFKKKVQNAKPGDTFNLEEDHHHNPNDDSDMAKIQLLQVAEYAQELLEMIKNGQELDAWIQAKITKIADYIGTVKHYLEGEEYLDAEYGKEHPAHGDSNFYNDIPEEYKAMYESWVASQKTINE